MQVVLHCMKVVRGLRLMDLRSHNTPDIQDHPRSAMHVTDVALLKEGRGRLLYKSSQLLRHTCIPFLLKLT